MDNIKLTRNFSLKEFNYVKPEDDLLNILQALREHTRNPIKITSSTRTVKEHIQIYKNIYGEAWGDKIPWGSRHLSEYGKGLRAVDLKAFYGATNSDLFWQGATVSGIVKDIARKLGVKIGVGVGKSFIHLDVDREDDATWTYNY